MNKTKGSLVLLEDQPLKKKMQMSMFVCKRVVVLTGGAAERGTRGGFESWRLGGLAVEGEEGLG